MKPDVIVCNLTRLGDLVQTQPLINDLAASGFSVGLVCLENFSAAIPLLKNVSAAWPLRGARLLSCLNQKWPIAVENILEFAANIKKEAKPLHVINLTPTLPARLLTTLLKGPKTTVYGFGLDEYGYGLNLGAWASFFAVAAQKRINAPFNLADMMRCIALPLTGGLSGDHALNLPASEDRAWAKGFLGQTAGAGYIAFQLGASEDRRRWPVSHFAALGDILYKEWNLLPVLLGSPEENSLYEKYAALAAHPHINAIGKTSLPQLAALLCECRLLVTNDTGTMHLASGLNVPGLAFFLATAQPSDTGPLLPGFCCLEPALECHPCAFGTQCGQTDKCRAAIKPETAARLISGWLDSGKWITGLTPEMFSECRIWQTGRDASGFSDLQSLSGHGMHGRGLLQKWMRAFWGSMLGSVSDFSCAQFSYKGLPAPGHQQEFAAAVKQAAEILDSIVKCGRLASRNPQMGQLFLRNCERLQALLDASPYLGALGAFWREAKNQQGDNLNRFLPLTVVMKKKLVELGGAILNAAWRLS